ncbi:MAG TPA: polysaccharide deacetylase family protein [Chitinophagales bacterium]|nr:polysaccharide deacetylase family protein [Chitinophagales bacterium]
MKKRMIFRNDDINVNTECNLFESLDALFKKYRVEHHIAIITNNIEQNAPLINYIRANKHIIPQVHCNIHHDFSTLILEEAYKDIYTASSKIFDLFGRAPTVWYPPYNKTNHEVNAIAESFGLKSRPDKISLSQYIRKQGNVAEDTINFHYWNIPDIQLLETALKIATVK